MARADCVHARQLQLPCKLADWTSQPPGWLKEQKLLCAVPLPLLKAVLPAPASCSDDSSTPILAVVPGQLTC